MENWDVYHLILYLFRLVDTQQELDVTKRESATTLLATEEEILQLKAEWVIH